MYNIKEYEPTDVNIWTGK